MRKKKNMKFDERTYVLDFITSAVILYIIFELFNQANLTYNTKYCAACVPHNEIINTCVNKKFLSPFLIFATWHKKLANIGNNLTKLVWAIQTLSHSLYPKRIDTNTNCVKKVHIHIKAGKVMSGGIYDTNQMYANNINGLPKFYGESRYLKIIISQLKI